MAEENKKSILIAEDEKPIASALKLKLENVGYQVTLAENGKEALDLLKKESFNLMLLDMIMPEMGGFDVLKELKKQGKKIPVIVASNLGQAEDVEQAKALGAVDYLVKSDSSLVDIVERIKSVIK